MYRCSAEVDVGWGIFEASCGRACGYNDRWPCRWQPLVPPAGSSFRARPVFEGLVPSFDFALGLRMVWCPADVSHLFAAEVVGKVLGDVGTAIVAEQPWFV